MRNAGWIVESACEDAPFDLPGAAPAPKRSEEGPEPLLEPKSRLLEQS